MANPSPSAANPEAFHRRYGGETRLDNLLQLCWHHHRLVPEGGFSCDRITVADGDDRIVFPHQYGGVIADGHVPETTVDTIDEVAWFEPWSAAGHSVLRNGTSARAFRRLCRGTYRRTGSLG